MPKLRDIIGHQRVLSELKRDIESDNVSHAYLLTGPRHIGKMTLAHWFVAELLTQGQAEEQAVKTKASIERLTHPDILVLDQLWIEGQQDNWDSIAHTSNVSQGHRSKKPTAKTDTIGIDEVRALQERLYETGTGRYRCCIIRSVERMQDAAANAFLKTLEEPPEGVVFLLTSQAPSSLLPTILSRSRVLRMTRVPRQELRPLLSDVSEDEAHFLLNIAQGAVGTLHSLVQDPDLLRAHRLAHTQAHGFWKTTSLHERLQTLKPLHKRSEEGDRLLLHLALTLRERSSPPQSTQAYHHLTRGLATNAHRQLLAQQFAMSV